MKNIKYKYIILALSGFFLVTSCDRELDINPEQSVGTNVVISTPESVEQILIGAYKNTGDGDLFGGDLQIYADILGDNGDLYWWGTYADLGNIYDKSIISNNVYIRDS